MSQIFLSYASEDRGRIRPLANLLEEVAPVWWDEKIRHGEQWEDAIEKAVERAGCIVVVWTADSVRSGWVKSEAAEARDRGILVPVLLDPVKIPLSFRHIETAQLQGWDGSSDHPEAQSLRAAVAAVMAGEAPAPAPRSDRLPPPPPRRGGDPGPRRAHLAIAGGGLIALALAGYLALQPTGPTDRAANPPPMVALAESTATIAAPGSDTGGAMLLPDTPAISEKPAEAPAPAPHPVERLGPFGGNGGRTFADICPVKEVYVDSGQYIDGVQLVCQDGRVLPQRGRQGGSRKTFILRPGERIVAISGETSTLVQALRIHTNFRSSPPYGNDYGGNPPEYVGDSFRLEVPEGSVLRGFFGRETDEYLVAIGIEYGESPGATDPSTAIP